MFGFMGIGLQEVIVVGIIGCMLVMPAVIAVVIVLVVVNAQRRQ